MRRIDVEPPTRLPPYGHQCNRARVIGNVHAPAATSDHSAATGTVEDEPGAQFFPVFHDQLCTGRLVVSPDIAHDRLAQRGAGANCLAAHDVIEDTPIDLIPGRT